MASYPSSFLLLLLSLLLCCSSTSAFNITDILNQTPDFSVFNSYLTQTLVAGDINSRQTITVLAVDNSAISAVAGQALDVIRDVLSVHVILDYYDVAKFQSLSNGTAFLVSMFQATGRATGQMGFLNATDFPWGVALGSAEPGAGLNANLVKAVFAEPYNISVLQVSSVIIPPGIQNTAQPLPPPPPPPPAAVPTPAAAPRKRAPAPKKAPSAAPTPAAAPKPAPTPKKAPSTAPTPAATPSAPAPASKDAPAVAPVAPEPSPLNPASPPTPAAQPPTSSAPLSPLSSAPAEAPAAAGTPSWGTRVAAGTGLAVAAAATGAALLVAF